MTAPIRKAGPGGAIALVLLLCGLGGCEDRPGSELPERQARRFLPFDPTWIPESEIPTKPQSSPRMVIWELSETLAEPGPEEERAAAEWIERCYESAQRNGWYDLGKALADGYEQPPKDPAHYRNQEFMLDDHLLDPDRPEFLMYYRKENGRKGLAGFMFITKKLYDRGPQIAGRLTFWHYHVWSRPRCVFHDFISLGFPPLGAECPEGEAQHRSPEMLHTWLIDHPEGPFATSMLLPKDVVQAGLEKRMSERGF